MEGIGKSSAEDEKPDQEHPLLRPSPQRPHHQKQGWDDLSDALVPLAFGKLSKDLEHDAERVFAWEGVLGLSGHLGRASPASRRRLACAASQALESARPETVWAATRIGCH